MCGIVGAVSRRNIVPVLIEGLRRLEYRGYDSCGVAVHQDGMLRRARSTARVAELDASVAAEDCLRAIHAVNDGEPHLGSQLARRHADVRLDRVRIAKPADVVDRSAKSQRRQRPHAWRGHQPQADRVLLRRRRKLLRRLGDRPLDRLRTATPWPISAARPSTAAFSQ